MTNNNQNNPFLSKEVIAAIIAGSFAIIVLIFGGVGKLILNSICNKSEKVQDIRLGDKKIECETTGQRCKPRRKEIIEVQRKGNLQVEYHPGTTHCAPTLINFYLDDKFEKYQKYEHPKSKDVQVINYPRVNLGKVDKGTYTLELEADGIKEGCNPGKVSSWSGDLKVYISPEAPIFCSR
ncbi:MAG: hypothetical protein QNJ68_02980 [Microcoleaceae cyanobacterium MO_207.B10]|nr:hypothetical protein [Microcoleaceae cyanobacterium MO_207.B10]